MKKLNLSSKAGLIALGSGTAQVITVLTTIVLARMLTKGDFGTYKQVFLLFSIFAPMFITGIPASIYYFLSILKSENEKKLFVGRAITLLLLLSFLLGLFISASSFWAPIVMNNPALGFLLVIFGVYAFANLSEQFFQPVLVVYNRFRMLLLYPVVKAILLFSTTIGAAIIFNKDLKIMIISVSVASLLLPIFAIIYTKKLLSLRKIISFSPSNYKTQLSYGIPLALTSVVGIIAWEFDKLVVSVSFPPELYAVYVIGATEIPFVALLRTSVSQVILPEMSRQHSLGKIKKLIEIWHNSIRKLSLLILPIFVIAMFFSREIITILYSDKFVSSVPYFRIYLLLLIVRVASYGIILQAIGKTKENFKGSLMFFMVNIALNPILVITLGLIGPAIATVIATFSNVIYYIFVIKKYMKFSLRNVFPWYSVGKNLFWAIIVGIVFLPVVLLLNLSDLPKLIISIILYAVLYLVVLYRLALLTSSDKKFIKETGMRVLRFTRVYSNE